MRTMITGFAGRFADRSATLRTLGRAVWNFLAAFGTVQHEHCAALCANQIGRLQRRAATWAALAAAVRADVSVIRHRLAAMRTGFRFSISIFK